MLSNPLIFLRGWSRDPVAVGLPFESSYWTARRLAQAALDAAIPGSGPVLELGAGTGAVTQALIEAGCPEDQIIVVERDAELCATLERRFRGLRVLHGNALEVGEILARVRESRPSARAQRLPMRTVAPEAAARCYSGAFQLMPSGGTIIQYTYGFRSPADPIGRVSLSRGSSGASGATFRRWAFELSPSVRDTRVIQFGTMPQSVARIHKNRSQTKGGL
jgi:phosphatidylethanolamine/phosphatidyl-N-methylethanolamine N-methyltransferase